MKELKIAYTFVLGEVDLKSNIKTGKELILVDEVYGAGKNRFIAVAPDSTDAILFGPVPVLSSASKD